MKSVLTRFLFLLVCTTPACAAVPIATMAITPLTQHGWPAQYQITLIIPPNHHAYLDKGIGQFYLPIILDPKATLAAAGYTLRIVEHPTGSFDTKVKATVLRGSGDFKIALNAV